MNDVICPQSKDFREGVGMDEILCFSLRLIK
jgi:hypothetical protein